MTGWRERKKPRVPQGDRASGNFLPSHKLRIRAAQAVPKDA